MNRLFLALGLLSISTSSLARFVRQVNDNDQIVFDDDLPEDMDEETLNRIAMQPVRYQPFTYNKKYF